MLQKNKTTKKTQKYLVIPEIAQAEASSVPYICNQCFHRFFLRLKILLSSIAKPQWVAQTELFHYNTKSPTHSQEAFSNQIKIQFKLCCKSILIANDLIGVAIH